MPTMRLVIPSLRRRTRCNGGRSSVVAGASPASVWSGHGAGFEPSKRRRKRKHRGQCDTSCGVFHGTPPELNVIPRCTPMSGVFL